MLKYEHLNKPVIPQGLFLKRLCLHAIIGIGFVLSSLLIGIIGYHYLEGMAWIDAVLNASMIAGGMGPVDMLKTDAGKLFASVYAVYSGMVLIAASGLLLAPVFHRILHRFHYEDDPA